jgi:hypothetical protein
MPTSDDPFRSLSSVAQNLGGDLKKVSDFARIETKRIITVGEVDFRPKGNVTEGLEKIEQRAAAMTNQANQPKDDAVGADNSHSNALLQEAVRGEYGYAKLGLGLGLAAIIGGVILGLNGVAGTTSWTAKALGFESNLNDAAPGVILFIVGVFMIFFTRPRVKFGKMTG